MIPPDQEIFEVEKRIALRRAQLKRHAGDARARATRSLASPIALIKELPFTALLRQLRGEAPQKPQ